MKLPSSVLLRRVKRVEGVGFLLLLLLLLSVDDVAALLGGRAVSPWEWIEVAAGAAMGVVTLLATRHLMQRIQVLEGLVSVCMHCRRIRDGDRWTTMEEYVSKRSAATFSHGLCPDCLERHYGVTTTDL
jgi:hypothetical protein